MVNIRKVAQKCNVSIATVSRVLNNNPNVKIETRNRIKAYIRRHGYLPNPLAQGLIQKKTWLVGIIVPDMYNQFVPTVVEPLTQLLSKARYQSILNLTEYDLKREEIAINEVLRFYCEALIFVGTRFQNDTNRGLIERIGNKIPVIMINALEKIPNTYHIYNDESTAIERVVNYLAGLGMKKISLVVGPTYHNTFSEKKRGFIVGLEKNNLNVDNQYIVEGVVGAEGGLSAVKQLLRQTPPPDSIVTGSDLIALGILKGLLKSGVSIPEQMKLVGYDNIPLAEVSNPGLTTVDQHGQRLGKKAAQMLLEIFEGKQVDREIRFVPEMFFRETT